MAKPPNLRFSDGEHDCSDCRAFKEQSQTCSMFDDYPVAPDLICDDWEANPHKAKDSGAVRADAAES